MSSGKSRLKLIATSCCILAFVWLSQAKAGSGAAARSIESVISCDYAAQINPVQLRGILSVIASDSFQGREAGRLGQKMAAQYIARYFNLNGIRHSINDTGYFQKFTFNGTYFSATDTGASENVVGWIPGTEHPDEYIVVSAHYDHLGIKDGKVYNGADDDGSGTTSLLAMAHAFSKAAQEGYRPKRSIVFIAFSGEEKGLLGSTYYSEHPLFPLAQTVVDLNIDMVGRKDKKHHHHKNYVYLIGSNILSQELDSISHAVNVRFMRLSLDYTYNSTTDPNHYYYRSDHYNFAKHGIPVIFYFNGVHADYHQPTDKIDKIDFELMTKRAQLVFHTAWELANRAERLKLEEQIQEQ